MSTNTNDVAERRVNTTTLNEQTAPSIVDLAGGGYVVVWQSQQAPADYAAYAYPAGLDLYMQRYDAAGKAVGGETHVNSVAIYDQVDPVVTATADGGYTVAWASQREHGMTSFDYGIYFQHFDAQGRAVGVETQANSYYNLNQNQPSIAALEGSDGFVVTWWSDVQSTTPPGLYMRRFGADGAPLTQETRIGTQTSGAQSNAVVTSLAGGNYVVAWDAPTGLYAQRFAANGNALGNEVKVNTGAANGLAQPSVSGLHDGGFVVVWQAADTDGLGIHFQRFDANGAAVGAETVANATTAGDQVDASVTAFDAGGFAIAWTSADGSGTGVFSQRFSVAGTPVGSEIQLDTASAGDQGQVAISANQQGGFDAAWVSADGSGSGVYTSSVPAPATAAPHAQAVLVSASGVKTAVVEAPVSAVLDYSVEGGTVTITTPAGTGQFSNVDRIQFDNALFALDTHGPTATSQGGHVWQAGALLWAGMGTAPGVALLSQWTAAADQAGSMGALAQVMLDYYAPGVATTDLVATLYTRIVHAAPSQQVVQALVDQIGPGHAYATVGDLFAQAASLSINTQQFADVVGSVQVLDAAWF